MAILTPELILSGITDRAWSGIGWSLERKMQASAVLNGIMLQELADGTIYEDLSDEKDTGQSPRVSRAEKFQRSCQVLRWIDNLDESYHYYEQRDKLVARKRPTFHNATEFLKGQVISKREMEQLSEAYGAKYAVNLAREESNIDNKRWDTYGESAIQMTKDEIGNPPAEDYTSRINGVDVAWNKSDMAHWLASKVQPCIDFKCDPDNEFSLPRKFGFRTPWVREAVGDMLMILPKDWEEQAA